MKISGFAIAAVVGLMALPLGLSPAKAQFPATVDLTGTAVVNSLSTIMFNSPAQIDDATATGQFATVFPDGGTTNVGMNTATRGTFTASDWNGTQLFGSTQLDVNNIQNFTPAIGATVDGLTALTFSGTADLGIMGVPGVTPGFWVITTQAVLGATSTREFSGTITAVPAPIVGAGLPSLIAALGGLVAMARRRRKQLA